MKPTSKILIGMALVPCALSVLAATAMLIFSSPRDGRHTPIPASEKTSTIDLGAFNQIKLICSYGSTNATICVEKSDDHSLIVPLNWEDDIKYNVSGSTLTLDLGSQVFGSGNITVCTPAISSVQCLRNDCEITGFESDSLCIFSPEVLTLRNCKLGHLLLDSEKDHQYISPEVVASGSVVDSLMVKIGNNLDLRTPNGGRINVATWNPERCSNSYFYTTINKANVGKLDWIPADDDQRFELNTRKNASIIFNE